MKADSSAYSLTEHEWPALAASTINLADAHARHSLSSDSVRRVSEVTQNLLADSGSDYFEAETWFREALTLHTGQHYPMRSSYLTYSASIALDVIGKYLRSVQGPIGMLTPTFDSVPALFGRSGLDLVPVPEDRILPNCDTGFLDSLELGALVVVAPNNPTGAVLTPDQACALLEWSARHDVLLVLDASFRMFDPRLKLDLVEMANDIGADVTTVDDTGKTIPLHDTKVGVLTATRALARDLGSICTDVLLNVSELNIRMLAALLEDDGPHGEAARARAVAAANQKHLEQRFGLTLDPPHEHAFQRSVAWLHLGGDRDAVVDACRARSVQVLPGDRFYWDRDRDDTDNPGSQWIRVPLLRDKDLFNRGLEALHSARLSVEAPRETV
ncbi:pyridoxal phosphate-dependent aminotransferase [Streptomyces coelicoflavus]|uniref:pyridoxal phosphate-dependent aminotransferase n=1 Tax=Streptomyces coelicoflavus TaxID=285562 RepID=UPI000D598B61|nr:pyridoxal phosphate-dependent aminotransferase [Streptomyces coelicoflavus]